MVARSRCALLVLGLTVLGMGCGSSGPSGPPANLLDQCTGPTTDTCNIVCVGKDACAESTFVCPEGLACNLNCEGTDSCDTSILVCPSEQPCTAQCEGVDACGDMDFRCDGGDCTMVCGVDALSCEGATLQCGSGACTATCNGSQPPTINCGSASSCTPCS